MILSCRSTFLSVFCGFTAEGSGCFSAIDILPDTSQTGPYCNKIRISLMNWTDDAAGGWCIVEIFCNQTCLLRLLCSQMLIETSCALLNAFIISWHVEVKNVVDAKYFELQWVRVTWKWDTGCSLTKTNVLNILSVAFFFFYMVTPHKILSLVLINMW